MHDDIDIKWSDKALELLNRELQVSIQHAQITHSMMALLYLDLDYFKAVNDVFGHAIGDKLLLAVAERLKNSLRKDDFILRLRADEFAIILNNLKQRENVDRIAEKLLRNISDKYILEGNQIATTASIGVALSDATDEITADLLIKNADMALHAAKNLGRNNYQYGT